MPKSELPNYLTDKYLAFEFVERYENKVRYCPQLGVWLAWDGRRWASVFDKIVFKTFDAWIKELRVEAAQEKTSRDRENEIDQTVKYLSRLNTQKRVLEYAMRKLVVDQRQLDQDTVMVNFKNGTLDLLTGQLKDHDPNDYITKLIEYDYNPAATADRWSQFLLEIMDGSQEMATFLQDAAGYGLTGSKSEHVLFMFYGAGRNGKSTFVETILELISGYGHAVTNEFFASDKKDTHPTAIADLRGKRFIVGSEFTGNRLNEALVKRLSGGDTQTARVMRGDYFNFKPTHKLFMLVNDKPMIHGTDQGIWERIKLVDFPVQFKKSDTEKDLGEKMISSGQYVESGYGEAEGILAWMVEGAKRFFRNGSEINYPLQVIEDGNLYRLEMDIFKQFLDDRIIVMPGQKIRSMALVDAYHQWCDENGVRFKGDKRWVHNEMQKNLKSLEGVEFKRSGGSIWKNLYWKPDDYVEPVENSSKWTDNSPENDENGQKNGKMDRRWTEDGQKKQAQTQLQQGNGQNGQKNPVTSDFWGKNPGYSIYLSTLSKMSIDQFKNLDLESKLELIEVAWMALYGEQEGREMFLEHEPSMREGSQDLLVDDFEMSMVHLKEKK